MDVRRAIGFVVVCCGGCDSAVDVVPPCDAPPEEIAAVERASGHLEAFRGRMRLSVTQSCADIARDLTGDGVAVDRPLDQGEAEAICGEAKPAIEERLDDGAELGAEVTDFGDCYPYGAAEAECLAECGQSPICELACNASGVFQAGCRFPSIRVESTDPELLATMQQHFAPILALDLFVAKDASAGMDDHRRAIADTRTNLGDGASCEAQRFALAERERESELAYDELIELLSWMRISRLTELD